MNERLKTTLVLLVLVVATGLAAYRQQVQRTRLVYADSLETAVRQAEQICWKNTRLVMIFSRNMHQKCYLQKKWKHSSQNVLQSL